MTADQEPGPRPPVPPRAVPAPTDLTAGAATDLAPEADCDGLAFVEVDLGGRAAPRSRLVDCRLVGCRLDDVDLRRARLTGCGWERVGATALDATGSTWLDVDLTGCRLGALTLHGADVCRLRLRGGKVDYLGCRDATLVDVTCEGTVLGEVDLAGARATRVSVDGPVGSLDVTAAVLHDVDLRGASLRRLQGLAGIAGAVVAPEQLTELAPALAAHVGLRVLPAG